MADPRTRKKPAPWTIEKIKASLLVNRLHKHIFGPGPDHKDHMSQSQVTAAIALLRKAIPDLAASEVEADVETHITVQWVKDSP